MSKRLQVLIDDQDLKEIQDFARRENISVAAWVRNAIHAAKQNQPKYDHARKLDVVRSAIEYSFPTAGIDQMIGEIESGYDAE